MQIKLKCTNFVYKLRLNYAYWTKKIDIWRTFVLIKFQRIFVKMFDQKNLKFHQFLKNLYKHHFWLVWRFDKKLAHQALFDMSDVNVFQ